MKGLETERTKFYMQFYLIVLSTILMMGVRGKVSMFDSIQKYARTKLLRNQRSEFFMRIRGNNNGAKNILALDFDGVVCASSFESSLTSIKAMQSIWKDCTIVEESEQRKLQSSIMEMRPIVETGYENILLARFALEELHRNGRVDTDKLLVDWNPKFRDDLLYKSGLSKEYLVDAFGSARDQAISSNITDWVSMNTIYHGVSDALRDQGISSLLENFYIITTKQERFVRAIMEPYGIRCPPPERLFDLANPFGPKTKVLQEILRRNSDSSCTIHFVEDR